MPNPTRIRAESVAGGVRVRMLMSHDMETGQRQDGSGAVVPAWFIQEVAVGLNGRAVLTAQWGTGIARNPFMEFVLKGAASGDRITVDWKDNHGETRSDTVTVA